MAGIITAQQALDIVSNYLIQRANFGAVANRINLDKYTTTYQWNIQRYGVNPGRPNGIGNHSADSITIATDGLNTLRWPTPFQTWRIFTDADNARRPILINLFNIIRNIQEQIANPGVNLNLIDIIGHQVNQIPHGVAQGLGNALFNQLQARYPNPVAVIDQTQEELFIRDAKIEAFLAQNSLRKSQETEYFPTIANPAEIVTTHATARYGQGTPDRDLLNYIQREADYIYQTMINDGITETNLNDQINIQVKQAIIQLFPAANPIPAANQGNLRSIMDHIRNLINNDINNQLDDNRQTVLIQLFYFIESRLNQATLNAVKEAEFTGLFPVPPPAPPPQPDLSSIVLHYNPYVPPAQRASKRHYAHSSSRCSSNQSNFAQRLNYFLSKPRQHVPNPTAANPTRNDIRESLVLIDNCIDARMIDLLRDQFLHTFVGGVLTPNNGFKGHMKILQLIEELGFFIVSYYTRIYQDPHNAAAYNPTGMHLTFRYDWNAVNNRASNYRFQVRLFNPLNIFANNRTVFHITEPNPFVNPGIPGSIRPTAGGKRRMKSTRKQSKSKKQRKTTRRQRK